MVAGCPAVICPIKNDDCQIICHEAKRLQRIASATIIWPNIVCSLFFVRHLPFCHLFSRASTRYMSDASGNGVITVAFLVSGILATDQGKRHSLLRDSREDGHRRALPNKGKEIIMAGVSHPTERTIVLVHGA